MPSFVAAVDQGTTSTRCIIFNEKGEILSLSRKSHEQIYPQPGWVEHDPLEIWEHTQLVIQESLQKAGVTTGEIAALGITNQRESTVAWSKSTGQPLANAVVWQDTRTSRICNRLMADGGKDRFRDQTGLPVSTYFSGPKINWLLDHEPEVQKAARSDDLMVGTIDTWLVWNLTGGVDGGIHITDTTNASRTLLMDLETQDWDENILKTLSIPHKALPRIQPSSRVYGETRYPVSGIPISGILGDQQAALFGQTCYRKGEAKNTYGTGCFLLLNTGTEPIPSENGLITTSAYHLDGQPPMFALEGSIAIAGALVQWLRDNLGLIDSSQEIEALAAGVNDNGGVYFVPAFSGLYAPYWRSDARGIIAGLTRYAEKGHIARAALESTAYQTYEILEAMEKDSGQPLTVLKVDGGMVFNDLLMQFQADILDVPVARPAITETTALGAAFAAGLAVGVWDDLETLRNTWREEKRWTRIMENQERKAHLSLWRKAVQRSLNWATGKDST